MKLILLKLLSFVPRNLPVGMKEFDIWSNRIISLSGPFADADSMKFALASQIMHLGAQNARMTDQYFIRSMRKAAANQVASQVFQDIKNKQAQAAEQKKEEDRKALLQERFNLLSNKKQALLQERLSATATRDSQRCQSINTELAHIESELATIKPAEVTASQDKVTDSGPQS